MALSMTRQNQVQAKLSALQAMSTDDPDQCETEAVNRLYALERAAWRSGDLTTVRRCQAFAQRQLFDHWTPAPDPAAVNDFRKRYKDLEERDDVKTSSLPVEETSDPEARRGACNASALKGSGGINRANMGTVKRIDILGKVMSFFTSDEVQTALRRHGMPAPPADPDMPDKVEQGSYEFDDFQAWVYDRCDLMDNVECSSRTLYGDFAAWCRNHDARVPSEREFGMFLRAADFTKRRNNKNGTIYRGITLKIRY